MLDSKVLNTDYDLAEMSDLQRPNLLDNADFKSGIINQRGFDNTTITGWSEKSTVDRWIFSGSGNATAEIDTDSMSISGDSYLIQNLSQQYQPGIYTVATNITDLTGTLKISLVYSDDTSIDETISGIGLFVHTFEATKDVKAIMFRCVGDSSSFTFDSIKLEKGSVYTGMPIWDYVEQFLKCERYYKLLGTNWGGMYSARSDENWYYVYIPITTPMEKVPSLVCVDSQDESSAYVALLGNVITNTTGIQIPLNEFNSISFINGFVLLKAPISSRKQIGFGSAVFSANVALDAEI